VIEVDINLNSLGLAEKLGLPKKLLGKVQIVNLGDHPKHPDYGNYEVRFFKRNNLKTPFKKIQIKDHPRKRESVWKLLKKAFQEY